MGAFTTFCVGSLRGFVVMTDAEIHIVHAADIHLDSPLRGLGRLSNDDLAARLRLATRAAFDNLIDHCLDTQPAALILAGDLYDGDWRDYSTGVYFTNRMRDLADAAIPVVFVQGITMPKASSAAT
jgi:DNA repair protein SbcD/Mre11